MNLEDDSTNARSITILDAGTSVSAISTSDAMTFNLGTLTYTGTITGETTAEDTLSLSTGADISGSTITNVEALELATGASVRLSATQNQNFTGAITAPGIDVNGEEITIAGDGAVSTLANIENYELEDDSTDARSVTISGASTNVVANSASNAVTFNLGALTYTGTIIGEGAVEDTLSLGTGADISGSTIANVAALNLASGASIRLSASQNQNFIGAIAAPGTDVNGEKITIVGDGGITTLANIETYELEDDSTNARSITILDAGTSVSAISTSDAMTFNLGTLTYTGTITGETTAEDTLSLGTGADISGSTITNVAALTLATGASVRLSAAQNQNFTGAITAAGTGVIGEEIIIAGDGAVSTLANIENYELEDDSTNARTVTITNAATNVTANSASDAVTFNLGALMYTGTITGENTQEDMLSLTTGADISGGVIANVESLILASGASIRLSATQNQNFTDTITAPGTSVSGEGITIAGDGAVTTLANIENYALEDESTDARTVTILGVDTNVVATQHPMR